MERDKALFADEVDAVVAALDLDDVGGDVRQRADAIEERVARARENARRRAEKSDAIEEAQARLKAIAEALDVNARQASAMTALFGVATLAEVAAKLEDCSAATRSRRRSSATRLRSSPPMSRARLRPRGRSSSGPTRRRSPPSLRN